MKDFFEPPDVSKSQWGSGSSQLSPSKPLDYILILIVVRNSSNLGVLYDYLKGFGFRVLIANDGPSALSIVDYVIPDIILLDTKLPGEMDGFDVCQQLKARKNTKHFLKSSSANIWVLHPGIGPGTFSGVCEPINHPAAEGVVLQCRVLYIKAIKAVATH